MNQNHHSPVAAFFDFDETLLAVDSATIGFKVLKDQGYLSKTFILKLLFGVFLKRLGLVDEQYMARTFLSFYKGREFQLFVDSAQPFYDEHLAPNLSPEVLQKLSWHQEQGHQTVLVTGSIDYYLKPVMDALKIDHLLCTYLEVDEHGILTGRPKGQVCVGEAKVTYANDLAKHHGIDFSQSYAYGNSENDIPILKHVGYPVIVNPTKGLAQIAKRHNWPSL
ncbi:MAG: HAD family hydrolase [Candidatus Marinimicrobia bacterium]|nr:HAD family hydrolase [Candidatus Neomarinimicrobiota bacterium]